jgi:predicted secreted protein
MREGPAESVRTGIDGALVLLPESPSTGYRWHLDAHPPEVSVKAALFQERGVGTPSAGASGTRAFLLACDHQKPVDVVFVLRRPWEHEGIERRVITLLPPAEGGERLPSPER